MDPLFLSFFVLYTVVITLVLVWIIGRLAVHIKEDDQVHKDVMHLQSLVGHLSDSMNKGKKK